MMGCLLTGVMTAMGAAALTLVQGYGLLAAAGFYVLGGTVGVIAMGLLIVLVNGARQMTPTALSMQG